MKIKLIHAADVVDGKKLERQAPGTELVIDEAQGQRLVSNGYATEVPAEEVQQEKKHEEKKPDPAA
ncbi:MAG TPA: hypothetical protein VE934_12030 [Polaromonas sp.]|uniref:hypothetical protein n=1 Tax=Polaromonas sp. TaxID=1869339 RepID=UPI002D4F46DC|nr:hypothetical protein [Polaromonas sp.]HYW57684.1 hypothetical protein [Polaromonas sp.]